MRLPKLQTLTWVTIVASIASALLLADDGDRGLPLWKPPAEQSSHPDADEHQQAPERATPGRRSNGHSSGSRGDERNTRRGPR